MTSTDGKLYRHDDIHDVDRVLRIPVRYRHDWMLFTDWCAAADQPPIPASSDTLALFLHEHPAAVATQRRRLSAINAIHTRHGHRPPGRSETVRRRLDTTRGQRLDHLARRLHRAAAELPTTGWPGGLFGRRDAVLLVLAATGMPFAHLAGLRRGDITVDGDTLVVTPGDGERWCVTPDPDADEHPAVAIYRGWAEIQRFLDAHPSTDLLRAHLIAPTEVLEDPLPEERARQPLLCPIDRWGHLPYLPQPMTPQSVAHLVRAHLSGRAPAHTALPPRPQREHAHDPDVVAESAIELDPRYYERGTAARRHAHQSLDGLTDVFDEIEHRTDALLEELLTVLDGL